MTEPLAGRNPIVADSPIAGEYRKRLLDEWAGRAMQGILAATTSIEGTPAYTPVHLAGIAYSFAEALLIEREQRIRATGTAP